ncbi:hypothetical protein [Eubacterium limosum]|uniref:hypothetical protein n=1 Tax=Eubacterium limosum TaxID=1736 RepID=UPI0037120254
MKIKNLTLAIVILFLVLIVVVILFVSKHDVDKKLEPVSVVESEVSNEGLNNSNNKEVILKEMGPLAYYDERSGFVFSYPKEYKVYVSDEYISLIPNDQNSVTFTLILNSDYETEDGVVTYNATYRLKERLTYYFLDGQKKTTLYDGGELEEANIGTNLCRLEKSEIYVSNIDGNGYEKLNSLYINGDKDKKGISIGYVAKESSSENDLEQYKQVLYEIFESIRSIEYTGTKQTEFPECLNYTTSNFNNINIAYPNDWNEYKIDDSVVVYKPVVMEGDILQGTAIMYMYLPIESSMGDPNSEFFESLSFVQKNSSYFGNANMQNPLIDNNRDVVTYVSKMESLQINGKGYYKSNFQHLVKNDDAHLLTSIPSKNIESYAYFTNVDGKMLACVFFYKTNINHVQMRQVSEYIMSTI